jgi:hypothetical protein
MIDKSKVPALAYSSMLEMLAERYHASPKLLLRLNPNVGLLQLAWLEIKASLHASLSDLAKTA